MNKHLYKPKIKFGNGESDGTELEPYLKKLIQDLQR